MRLLKLTLPTAEENIALDEALLEMAESGDLGEELIRIWEPLEPAVVIGRSSPIATEVNLDHCLRHGVPVIRRASGGAAIVTGPGCLMYAVLLDYRKRPALRMLDQAHEFVMKKMESAVRSCGIPAQRQGISDLAISDLKFSGNSLRCKRDWMLYHGTILCCDFRLQLVVECLAMPVRQPEYRRNRGHQEFLTRLPIGTANAEQAIIAEWEPARPFESVPFEKVRELIEQKYSTREWNEKI